MYSIHNKWPPKWSVKPWTLINHFSNPANNLSTYKHLSLEIEYIRIIKFIKPYSYCCLVPYTNKTASFRHICHISYKQVALTHGKFCTILQYFVSKISLKLILLIELLKSWRWSIANGFPIIYYRLART